MSASPPTRRHAPAPPLCSPDASLCHRYDVPLDARGIEAISECIPAGLGLLLLCCEPDTKERDLTALVDTIGDGLTRDPNPTSVRVIISFAERDRWPDLSTIRTIQMGGLGIHIELRLRELGYLGDRHYRPRATVNGEGMGAPISPPGGGSGLAVENFQGMAIISRLV